MSSQTNPWNYRHMFLWALVQNVFLFAMTLLALDGGRLFRAAAGASLAYWFLAMLIWTHHESAEKHEVFFVRWGMCTLAIVVLVTGVCGP